MLRKNNNTSDIYLVANKYGWEYQGDCNIEHGGCFYKLEDWDSYGYADAVQVSVLSGDWNDNGFVDITVGSINKKSDLCTDTALIEVYGAETLNPDSLIHLQIDNCRSNCGVEPSYGGECFELSECGEYFNANGNPQNGKPRWISIDDLQGWIVANYLND